MKQLLYSEFQQRLSELDPTSNIIIDHKGQPVKCADGVSIAELKSSIALLEADSKQYNNPIIEFELEAASTNIVEKQNFMASVMAQINNRKANKYTSGF